MKFRLIAVAIAAATFFPVLSNAENIVLICHPSVPVSALTKYEVNNIFLGKKITWDPQTRITFAIQKECDAHKRFCLKRLNKTSHQFTNYWREKLFSGKGLAPLILEGDREMIKFVSNTNGAIGYISEKVALENVKTIFVKGQ